MSKRVNNKPGNRVAKRTRKAAQVRGGGRYHHSVDRGYQKLERLLARLPRLSQRYRKGLGPYMPHQGARECARRVARGGR